MFVYFIEAIGLALVKIGCTTKRPQKRLQGLRGGSPSELRLHRWLRASSRDAEGLLHERFKAHRSHGEWFHFGEEIRAYLDSKQDGDTTHGGPPWVGEEREPGLSGNERKVLRRLKQFLTLGDVQSWLGCSEGYARFLTHTMVKKGGLERLRNGLFQAAEGDTNPFNVGNRLIGQEPHLYSFGTACTHHGFTEQVFSEIYLACLTPRRPTRVRSTRFLFVPMPRQRLLDFEVADVLGVRVQMATKERALLDALDRPRYAGGVGELSRIVARAASRIAWPKLFDLLTRWGEAAVIQRLGYLLDLQGIQLDPEVRAQLLSFVPRTTKLHFGPRSKWGTHGNLNSQWGIIENVPHHVLAYK